MKKILILGAGNAQIDAIEYCHRQGITVAGCSYTNTDAGIPLLDEFEQVDIKDIDGVSDLARRIGADAVYSVGSDLAVPTAMAVSERLGLPHFISYETAMICHSKHLTRQKLGPDFEGNLRFLVCSSVEEAAAADIFPAMMKPVDSQGQRGCFRVDSREDIIAHFATSLDYSKEKKVIIEEFVDGPEVSVNAYLQGGELRFAIVSDRYVFDEYPGGIIKKHMIPSTFTNADASAESIDLTFRAAKAVGAYDGPVYAQIKIDRDGHPKLLEIAPRLDGCHMWNLIKHYCGADLLDATFTHLLDGSAVLTDEYKYPADTYSLTFLSMETGRTFDRSIYDTAGAEYVCWYYDTGDTVRKLNGYIEKCGYMIKREEQS
ncbi:MAG: ATP-grasp domain-containing protein [Bacillota bacterium]|nr:ATP-grasp domain-containing protein [Bacillota bacterium]